MLKPNNELCFQKSLTVLDCILVRYRFHFLLAIKRKLFKTNIVAHSLSKSGKNIRKIGTFKNDKIVLDGCCHVGFDMIL